MVARKPGGSGIPPRSAPVDVAREAALRLLVEFEAGDFPVSRRAEQIEAKLARPADRRFFHSLVYETLRHRLRIDHVLGGVLAGRGLAALPSPIRNLLRLGACQLLLLSDTPAHAAVNTSVALAHVHGHAGTAGLVNAVLRRLSREGAGRWEEAGRPPEPAAAVPAEAPASTSTRSEAQLDAVLAALAVRYSHPLWLVRRWAARWGTARTEAMLAFDNSHPDYWLRLAPGATPPEGSLAGWIPGSARLAAGTNPAQLSEFSRGTWTIQDGSGILVGLAPPEVCGLILDLCAAPGTKTGHLRERAYAGDLPECARADDPARAGDPPERAQVPTRIVALDLSPGRLRRLRRGLARVQARVKAGPVQPELLIAADGRRIPLRPPWDGVLCDAPCSNLGVLRRRVDVKWRVRESEIERLAGVQAELCQAAAQGLAPGGWLVYSVCTLEPEETTAQRDRFLAAHPGWEPIALPPVIPAPARGREGEMILLPGELETDGGYAFAVRRPRSS